MTPGTKLGPYEIVAQIGAGGMGEVYKARDTRLDFQRCASEGVNALRAHHVPTRDGQRFLINTRIGDPAPTPITVVLNWTAALKK